MIRSALTWIGNVLLVCVLVVVTTSHWARAQEVGDDSVDTELSGEGSDVDTVPASGRILVPLSGSGTASRNGPLVIEPALVNLGLVEIGQSSEYTVRLTHTGSAESDAIAINAASFIGKSTPDFRTPFNGFVTLLPGESMELTVTFEPRTPGGKSAGLQLDVEGATYPYVLLFDGESRYPLTSKLTANKSSVAIGTVFKNTNGNASLALSNEGESGAPNIFISALELSGQNPGAFSSDFSPMSLAPGETAEIAFSVNTTALGYKSASITVLHDGINPALEFDISADVVSPGDVPVNFGVSNLGTSQAIARGTSIQFGPDQKLYVAEMDGPIHVFDVTRKGKNNYSANKLETINLIKNVPNHNDDGSVNNSLGKRLLTGIHVTGTAAAPVIYAASSDPRQAAGPSGTDSGLDTNSGILHKLTKTGGGWSKQDLVRGLPRSEENHVANGLVKVGNKIYLNVGGNTNMGRPSNNFASLPEYALSGATLEIDLGALGNLPYDLPTLDDETRNGSTDNNDPFGGNNGLNQAILESNGPVKLFATGLRNAYDIVYTETGKFYTWDNGPNTGWGAKPDNNCSNNYQDAGGNTYQDGLHKLEQGYYAGHPNPTRGNKQNTFNASNPQSPIEGAARPEECDYLIPGQTDGSLTTYPKSTNGIVEYTATNFAGTMRGNILAVSQDGSIRRVILNNAGTAATTHKALVTGLHVSSLDITTQGDEGPFPGTIWVVANFDGAIKVLEPSDY